MSKVFVVGSCNIDMVVKTTRIPQQGETVLGGDFSMHNGGKGANQAVAVSRLGGDVVFCSRVGNDIFGNKILSDLKKDDINAEHIVIDKDAPSGVALITINERAENAICVASGANMRLMPQDTERIIEKFKPNDILLLQLETPMETIIYVAKKAHEKGLKVILNPAPSMKLPDELFAYLYLLTPNEHEAYDISGINCQSNEDMMKIYHKLAQQGLQNLIITLGAKGAFYATKETSEMVDGFQCKAVDTTAAGDTFNGALCVALSEGKTLHDAIVFANKAASISVTRMGAQPSIPYRDEIN